MQNFFDALEPPALARRLTLVVGAACSVAAWLTAGTPGLIGGVVATALVVGFFWSGMIPLEVIRRTDAPAATGLSLVLMTYSLRLVLVVVILMGIGALDFVDSRWTGLTLAACALVFAIVQVVAFAKRRKPTPISSGE